MLIESEDFKEISKETLHFHGAVRNRRNRPKIRRNRSKSHGNVRNQEKYFLIRQNHCKSCGQNQITESQIRRDRLRSHWTVLNRTVPWVMPTLFRPSPLFKLCHVLPRLMRKRREHKLQTESDYCKEFCKKLL